MLIWLNQILDNIRELYSTYGKQNITTDKRLLLLYWRDIDGVEMDKEHFSTSDWLNKATDPITILNGKMLIQAIYESERK